MDLALQHLFESRSPQTRPTIVLLERTMVKLPLLVKSSTFMMAMSAHACRKVSSQAGRGAHKCWHTGTQVLTMMGLLGLSTASITSASTCECMQT